MARTSAKGGGANRPRKFQSEQEFVLQLCVHSDFSSRARSDKAVPLVLTAEDASFLALEFNFDPVIDDEAAFDLYPRLVFSL